MCSKHRSTTNFIPLCQEQTISSSAYQTAYFNAIKQGKVDMIVPLIPDEVLTGSMTAFA